jgi:hypothetical protein
MITLQSPIFSKVRLLADIDKLKLVDLILHDLDKPDPEIDMIWADESEKRLNAYKKGKLRTKSHAEVMKKYKTRV